MIKRVEPTVAARAAASHAPVEVGDAEVTSEIGEGGVKSKASAAKQAKVRGRLCVYVVTASVPARRGEDGEFRAGKL